MPQAKSRFIVVGKFIDAKGLPVRAGSLIDLEVDEGGKPVDGLMASRVKPFKGQVVGETPVPADVQQYIADAEEQVKAMTEQANKEALEVVNAAKAEAAAILKAAGEEAAAILKAAGEEAERIINDATKPKK